VIFAARIGTRPFPSSAAPGVASARPDKGAAPQASLAAVLQ
jgi:hypothetical protein